MLFIAPLNFISFIYIIKFKEELNKSSLKKNLLESVESEKMNIEESSGNDLNIKSNPVLENKEASINEILTFQSLKRIFNKLIKIYLSNVAIYIFEFLSITQVMHQTSEKLKNSYSKEEAPWWVANSFELLVTIYQTFVFIFRFSLVFYRVSKIYMCATPTAVFALIFFIQSLLSQVWPFWVLVLNISCLGIFAGTCYCNLNYLTLNHHKLHKSEKVFKF